MIFQSVSGYSWSCDTSFCVDGDSVEQPDRSRLELFENGQRLGPAHSNHQQIAEAGCGAYSHWAGSLIFSASDNTDPNNNGRTYQARVGNEIVYLIDSAGEFDLSNHTKLMGNQELAKHFPFFLDPTENEDWVANLYHDNELRTLKKLYAFSMLSIDTLSKLRYVINHSEGAVLEVGCYIGGSTCAIGDAMRATGRKHIVVEPGGSLPAHPSLPSNDILADWHRNVCGWGIADQTTLIPKFGHEAADEIADNLQGEKLGVVFIDADGAAGLIIAAIKHLMSDNCILILDDFGEDTKGSGVKQFVEDALNAGCVDELGFGMDFLPATGMFPSAWFGKLIKPAEQLPEAKHFTKEEGHSWFCYLPIDVPHDSVDAPRGSSLELFENGKRIGPAHSMHEHVRDIGRGLYSHWAGRVYMSATDNSNPNENGRAYQFRVGDKVGLINPGTSILECDLPERPRSIDSPMDDDFAELLASPNPVAIPVNFQVREEDIQRAAEHSINIGTVAADISKQNGLPLDGRILELGPGTDFGPALLLGENASELVVADRFLSGWQEQFHPLVYRKMQTALGRKSRLLDRVVENDSYDGAVTCLQEDAGNLSSIEDNSIDLIYSNAVLEHVHPLDAAIQEMFRVTQAGGYGAHQVDFRYHRDFDLPLEHLLLTYEEYQTVLDVTHCEAGCQTRINQASEMFEQAGFTVVSIDVNIEADCAYLDNFLARLKRAKISPYQEFSREELAGVSARFIVMKP